MYHYTQGHSSNLMGFAPDVQGMSSGLQMGTSFEGMQFFPKVDVVETQNEVIYIFDVPGVEQNAVNVEIAENSLYVNGQINLGLGIDGLNYLYRERPNYQRYSRNLTIPKDVDSEQAAADVKNGLLMVRFPKKLTGRRLPVNEQQQQHQPPLQQHQQQQHQQPPQQTFTPNAQNFPIQDS